jgi:hypothetical protein
MSKHIVDVEAIGSTLLIVTFTGGERRVVDIAKVVRFDGVFANLAARDFFRQVRVNSETGTIEWPNGADLCPDVVFRASLPVNSSPTRFA